MRMYTQYTIYKTTYITNTHNGTFVKWVENAKQKAQCGRYSSPLKKTLLLMYEIALTVRKLGTWLSFFGKDRI